MPTGNFPVLICDVSHSAQMCRTWVLNSPTCNFQLYPVIVQQYFCVYSQLGVMEEVSWVAHDITINCLSENGW